MNLLTLQRFKNEILLVIALMFAIFSAIYKSSANSYVEENQATIQQQITEISSIDKLKKMWGGKGLANKVKTLKTIVPKSKVKTFNKKSKKLTAVYINLNTIELNKITNKLINMPVQITLLNIKKTGKEIYKMEFTCKW